MLTNNYKLAVRAMYGLNQATLTDTTGNTFRYYPNNQPSALQSLRILSVIQIVYFGSRTDIPSSGQDGFIMFGSGRTPATPDDFTIEAPITTGLANVSYGGITTREVEGGMQYYKPMTLNNTSATEITVGELCVFGAFNSTSGSSTASYKFALIDRVVFDDPIVIPPGEVRQIQYTVTIPDAV